jgi:hypothetical protein
MKSTPEGHGGTIPADLGPAIERTKEWTDADEKRKRREAAEWVVKGAYRFKLDSDGKFICEPVPLG